MSLVHGVFAVEHAAEVCSPEVELVPILHLLSTVAHVPVLLLKSEIAISGLNAQVRLPLCVSFWAQ